MDIQEAASRIDGNQYRDEVSRDFADELRRAGLVAIFGASDDLTEFEGAIRDEVGAGEDSSFRLTQRGLEYNRCDCDDCPNWRPGPNNIRAQWDVDGFSWVISSEIPNAAFMIMEDDETYCKGIVLRVADLPA